LLNKGNAKDAVLKSLENPPFNANNQKVKDTNAQTVLDALNAVKSADIAGVVSAMNVDQRDVLMKYIYRGLAEPEKFPSDKLLAWHAQVIESGGLGHIVRVLTSRKTV